jgi:predicted Kef-type K+ transport protein
VTDGVHLLAAIAISLAFALAGGMLFSRLGLPEIVGYLVAGIAIGPFTPGFVGDTGVALRCSSPCSSWPSACSSTRRCWSSNP